MNRLLNLCCNNSIKLHSRKLVSPFILKYISPLVVKPINYQIATRAIHSTRLLKFSSIPLDINPAALVKDVIVFKYDNPRFFKILNIFALCQFFFWNYLAEFSFSTLRDAPVEEPEEGESKPWYMNVNLGENKYRNTLTVFCFAIGFGVLAMAWMYTTRSVRFLILRKGGANVSFVTYGPFGRNRIMNVPLNCLSAEQSRATSSVQLPIKVKGKSLFYILDMKGEFLNEKLFDHHVGLRRKLNVD